MNIEGTIMLITGASRGIGRALAIHFAGRGARVLLTGRREEGLQETARRIEAQGHQAWWKTADLLSPGTLAELVRAIEDAQFEIDILINNAADVTSKPLLATSLEEIETIVQTNVTGCLQLCRLIAPSMARRRKGMIVNISSLAGYKPNPRQTVYSASKGAVNSISRSLQAELGSYGIHVLNVALSSVATEEEPRPSAIDADNFARRLERAIRRDQAELFLSPASKWLMRLYQACPSLARYRP